MFKIPFVVRMFLSNWWPALLAGVVIIGGITAVYLRGASAGKAGEQTKAIRREVEVQKNINDANENASIARVEATIELEKQAQELQDAEKDAGTVDAIRIKRGCVILRQQGRDISKIPACR